MFAYTKVLWNELIKLYPRVLTLYMYFGDNTPILHPATRLLKYDKHWILTNRQNGTINHDGFRRDT